MKTPKEIIAELLRRPARAAALVETQTEADEGDRAMVGNLKRELAEHPSRGLTPARLYQILEAAEAGDLRQQHALFADMEEKDIILAAALMRRKNATAGLEWQIVPPDNATLRERNAADHAAEVFSGLDVASLVMDLGDAIGHGWVQLELPWTRDGAHRVPEQPTWREHAWFMTAPERPREIRLRDGTAEGEALWPLGWVNHRHRARSGYPARVGLHRALVWPYLFRNYALGDLAELLEILGIPARLGKYPHGASEAEKATLLRAVTSMGHSAAGIIPESMAIEYLEAAEADGDAHLTMIDWCDRSTTKAILGGTLTTGTDGGAYALGQIHQESLDSLIASDARQYAETIRRDVLWPMAALNFGITDPRRAPRWYLDLDQVEDFAMLAETLPTFVETGMKIPMWWFHEKSGIPRAAPGDPICQPVRSRAPQAVR
jgi:phage gp29-like protein